ncbi:MAG: mechanosensitive ion channel family protein [Thermoanaerobaculia bacterium]
MDTEWLKARFADLLGSVSEWASGPQFYAQVALAVLAVVIAYSAAGILKRRTTLLSTEPATGAWLQLRRTIYQARDLLFPSLTILALGIAVVVSEVAVRQGWLVRICQSLAVVFLLYSAITRFIKNPFLHTLVKWIAIPVAILYVFDWLDGVVVHLEAVDAQIGNIRISAYGLIRVLTFGSILFWLGRLSNHAGQRVIREQKTLEIRTREVLAKLFQGLLFFAIVLLLLQIMGINLTTLAVFGGALGVGLGFGLQAIASNFVSGVIILLDRSLTVGDYVELEDGKAGVIREMNMRSTVLETFDGKDIVVPNESFITATFTNWTHKNQRQRYPLEFQVAYETDIPRMLDLVREVVRSHPQVIDGPDVPTEELADAEIKGFGESGIDILVEFWMEEIDDGKNHVGADLLLMIWQALKDNDIEIPFPQREVRILAGSPAFRVGRRIEDSFPAGGTIVPTGEAAAVPLPRPRGRVGGEETADSGEG